MGVSAESEARRPGERSRGNMPIRSAGACTGGCTHAPAPVFFLRHRHGGNLPPPPCAIHKSELDFPVTCNSQRVPSKPAPYIRVILSRDAEEGTRDQPELQPGQPGSRQGITVTAKAVSLDPIGLQAAQLPGSQVAPAQVRHVNQARGQRGVPGDWWRILYRSAS